nr:uncharacterized mitochondrial protein AtMg00810-like [Tanacetum cinerariifolium]
MEHYLTSVDNDMAKFLAKNDGYGTQSLLEQWKNSHEHDDYEYDPYDEDLYEGHEIPETLQAFCDRLDIKVGVILNGDSPIPTRIVDGVSQVIAPTTVEQRLAKKNELKAMRTLLMSLPDKHQLKFNIHKDAKSLMEAIEKRLEAIKRQRKLQKLISQLEILGESISQEDINLKFLRSLPSKWKTHTLIWRNKANLEDQSLDDFTNESVNVVLGVTAASSKASVSTLPNVDSLSDVVIYSFFVSQSNSPQLENEYLKQIDADYLEEMDLKWECRSPRDNRNKDTLRRTVPVEVSISNALVSQCDRVGLESVEARLVIYQHNENVFEEDIKLLKIDVMLRDNALVVLKKKFEKAGQERDELKHTLEKFQTSLKNLSKLLESQITDKTGLGYDTQVFKSQVFDCDELNSSESDDSVPTSPVHDRYKSGEGYHVVPPLYTGTFMPPKPDLVFHDAPPASETVLNVVHVESSTNKTSKEMSKSLRPDAPIIKDWTSDSEDEYKPEECVKTVEHPQQAENLSTDTPKSRGPKHSWNRKACFVCKSLNHLIKDCDFYKKQMVQTLKSPYNLLLGRTPSIGFMRPFGCPITILNTLDPLGKFDGKADEGFLVLENQPNVVGSGPKWLFDIDTLTQSMNYQPVVVGNQPNHNSGIKENLDAGKARKEIVSAQQYVLLPLWSNGSQDPQNTDVNAAFDVKETENEVHVSTSSSDKPKKHDEKAKREAKGNSPVDLSTGVRDLRDKFEEFSVNSTNRVNAASAPVTVVGPNPTNSTNSFNASSPSDNVVSPTFEIGRKSSFVDPFQYLDDLDMPALEDIIYSDDEEDVGLKVVKELYGFNQAPRAWYETLANYLLENGFQREKIDQTLFIKKQKGDILLVQMSSMGELTFFLGLQVKQKDDGIFISQDKYVAEILRKFGLTYGKSASTPIDTEKPLLNDPDGKDVDVHIYRSVIGSLMYLTSSRPDIMFVVYACARFQVTPKVSHLHAIQRIFRYLKGKPHLGLWYPKDSSFNLVAYSDSDYAGASLDRKSITGGYQFLSCRLISWQCKKQTVIATSSTEAEYVAAAS